MRHIIKLVMFAVVGAALCAGSLGCDQTTLNSLLSAGIDSKAATLKNRFGTTAQSLAPGSPADATLTPRWTTLTPTQTSWISSSARTR